MRCIRVSAAMLLLAVFPLAGEGSTETLRYTLSYVVQSPEMKLLTADGTAAGQGSLFRPSWGEFRILDVNVGVRSIPILYGTTLAKTDDGTYFTFFPLRIGFPLAMEPLFGGPFAWGVLLSAELDWNRLNAKDVFSESQKYPLLDARVTLALPVVSAYVSLRKTVFHDTPTRAALFDGLFFGFDLALGSPVVLELPKPPERLADPVEGDFRLFRKADAAGVLYLKTIPADAPVAERTVAMYGFYLLSASARSGGMLSVIVQYPDGSGAQWRMAADDLSRYLAGEVSDRNLGQAIRVEARSAAELKALVP